MKKPSTSQSYLRFPLDHVLGSESCVRLLRSLIAHAGPLGVTQLARDSGLSVRGTRQVLDTLVKLQIVKILGQPRAQLFAVDFQHPLTPGLKALFASEQSRWDGLLQALRDILQPMAAVEAAWYYGSVARGEDAPRSDLDIAIVAGTGDADTVAETVRQALLKVEDDYYVSCSVVALAPADVTRLSTGDAWWNGLAHAAKTLKGGTPVQYVKNLLRSARK